MASKLAPTSLRPILLIADNVQRVRELPHDPPIDLTTIVSRVLCGMTEYEQLPLKSNQIPQIVRDVLSTSLVGCLIICSSDHLLYIAEALHKKDRRVATLSIDPDRKNWVQLSEHPHPPNSYPLSTSLVEIIQGIRQIAYPEVIQPSFKGTLYPWLGSYLAVIEEGDMFSIVTQHIPKDRPVISIGSGLGLFEQILHEEGYTVVCVDPEVHPSAAMLPEYKHLDEVPPHRKPPGSTYLIFWPDAPNRDDCLHYDTLALLDPSCGCAIVITSLAAGQSFAGSSATIAFQLALMENNKDLLLPENSHFLNGECSPLPFSTYTLLHGKTILMNIDREEVYGFAYLTVLKRNEELTCLARVSGRIRALWNSLYRPFQRI